MSKVKLIKLLYIIIFIYENVKLVGKFDICNWIFDSKIYFCEIF